MVCSRCEAIVPRENQALHQLRCTGNSSSAPACLPQLQQEQHRSLPESSLHSQARLQSQEQQLYPQQMPQQLSSAEDGGEIAMEARGTGTAASTTAAREWEVEASASAAAMQGSAASSDQGSVRFPHAQQQLLRQSPEAPFVDLEAMELGDTRGAQASAQWSCPACTFANAAGSSRCEMCMRQRVPALARSSGRSLVTPLFTSTAAAEAAAQERVLHQMTLLAAEEAAGRGLRGAATRRHAMARWGGPASAAKQFVGVMMGGIVGMFLAALVSMIMGLDENPTDQIMGLLACAGSLCGFLVASCGSCQHRFAARAGGPQGNLDPRPFLDVDDWPHELSAREVQHLHSLLAAARPAPLLTLPGVSRGPTDEDQVADIAAILEALPPRRSALRPAHVGIIDALPTHVVTAEEASAAASQQDCLCTICIENFKEGDRLRTLPCFHRFHADCVDTWLRRSGVCPTCKHGLVDQAVAELA
eukprot:TRINITY_DN10250_c0_g1_i1.p1 TRINITY_DN10250_c0_g1~~TRINITY_DN10250_c0_g1_i1.p1  ORF type:complete len:503 (+),score=113.89 TRINITY_DN10250_c0_g1_i1:86-1510(+)